MQVKKKSDAYKKINLGRKSNNKIIFSFLVTFILISGTLPIVLAKHEDTLVITFDPNADIDIDVSNATYDFGTVLSDVWTNTTGEYFTLYNNGTIAMDTAINCSNITQEGNMSLNTSAQAPQQDEFAIYIQDLTTEGYLNESLTPPNAYHTYFDQDLAPSGSKTFDICLLIGVNISANHSSQTTTITFRGSEHTP